MANRALRIAVAAATLVAFVVLWSSIAAKPWTATSAPAKPDVDPRLAALDRWERQLRSEAAVVKRTVDRRWAAYRKRLSAREAAIAAAKRRYAQEVAAARAAQARIAALQQAAALASGGTAPARQKTVTTYTVSRVAPAPAVTQAAAAPVAAPTTKVVTLPPQVQVVTLPPASAPAPVTKSTSSKP